MERRASERNHDLLDSPNHDRAKSDLPHQARNGYDLAVGSWVGPYAMCRTWESLVRFKREESELEDQSFPMAIYVVSVDEDEERGGAPIVCIEYASRHCFEFSKGQANWTPILLLVPLVLGLDKINPRTPCLPSAIPERFAGGLSCQGMTIRLTGCGLCQYGNTNPGFTGAPSLTIRPSAYSDP
ncbi:hypothetical protein HYC85_000450 [Camellia sinensis]|uniref:Cysteine protease n=1 Tax=Camellia sinensis TaxID=4442 RepID=A0A7J7I3V3_CAMSI|nr:hypothetical protein HYC85_000450 [Camellia sinensis]